MASSIILPTGTFNLRSKGIYVLSTAVFNGPADELRIRPSTNRKQPSVTFTRYKQVSTNVDPLLARLVPHSVSLSINVANDPAVTTAVLVAMINDLKTAATGANLNTTLVGDSEIAI